MHRGFAPWLDGSAPCQQFTVGILTRILWLTGLERGRNRGGPVDTLRRFIYVHGCPDITPVGVPGSHGCIRMRNRDLLELFELVETGTLVDIVEGGEGG